MGLLHRRLPFYGRPLPFITGLAVAAWGIAAGLGWSWSWSLQTGNVFLLLILPRTIVPFDAGHAFALVAAAAGLAWAFAWGLRTREGVERDLAIPARGWKAASFRFFPTTVLFGLFLFYVGVSLLFDASLYGDKSPTGYAAFVYLDYAGLLDRPITTALGVLLVSTGIACTTTLAFERGLGMVPEVAPARRVAASSSTIVPPLPAPRASGPANAYRVLGGQARTGTVADASTTLARTTAVGGPPMAASARRVSEREP